MCGIAGFGPLEHPRRDRENLERMAAAIRHRGPDATGIWLHPGNRVGFAHTRLAVLDLTESGAQPMQSRSGRYTIAFNGEVFNFRELRRELERLGTQFRGGSDTEVMLAAFEAWGMEAALTRFNGMFAFALWDEERESLSLVRDRLGIKPLYYGWNRGALFFASELKPFFAHTGFDCEVEPESVAAFVQHGYVPSPLSILENVRKLPPGCILAVPIGTRGPAGEAEPTPYWSAASIAGVTDAVETPEECLERLEELLRSAIELRMISDVPLGAFLSGGIDSSLVVALMQRQSNRPVKTFTIGFQDPKFDEASYARAISAHLGTDHTEVYVSPREALDVVPELPRIFDEPFSDASQIPTQILSRIARQSVTVSLSGDGGDELFAGYDRYRLARRVARVQRMVPAPLRDSAATALAALPGGAARALLRAAAPVLPARFRRSVIGDRQARTARMIRAGDLGTLYGEIVRHWMASEVMPGSAPITSMGYQEIQGIPHIRQLQLFDLDRYLPDDILVKLDRASMSVALEARVPLLDFRIVEFALGLAPRIVEWDSRPKWPLRALLARHVPTHLFERPKAGFGVPLASWLRGELRDWAEALLDPGRIRDQGFFDPAVVATVWAEHQEGDCEWHYHLWDLLMFQSWYDCSFLQHRNMSSCEREVSINQSEPHRRGEPA